MAAPAVANLCRIGKFALGNRVHLAGCSAADDVCGCSEHLPVFTVEDVRRDSTVAAIAAAVLLWLRSNGGCPRREGWVVARAVWVASVVPAEVAAAAEEATERWAAG